MEGLLRRQADVERRRGGGMDADGLERPSGVGVVFLDRDRETGDRILEEVEKRSARYLR